MTAAPLLVVWFTLAALALAGIVADGMALRRDSRRVVSGVALGLKLAVALAFGVYFVLLRAGVFSGWQDLTTFASILVLSLAALAVSLVLDVVVVLRLFRGSRK